MSSFNKDENNVYNIKKGAKFIVKDWSIIDVWFYIHQHASVWSKSDMDQRNKFDGSDFGILNSLVETSATNWIDLCNCAGPTVYGAVGLSWCRDAVFTDVLKMWLASGFILKPLPEYERPARFINPAMLPDTNSLEDIAGWHNRIKKSVSPELTLDECSLAVCIKIASMKEPLLFDMDSDRLKGIHPQIIAFLKSRMLQKPQHTAEEMDMIKAWDAALKGYPYDVWEGA